MPEATEAVSFLLGQSFLQDRGEEELEEVEHEAGDPAKLIVT